LAQLHIDAPTLHFGDLLINENTHEVHLRGALLELTSKEFALLAFLARSPRQVFSREQLLERVGVLQRVAERGHRDRAHSSTSREARSRPRSPSLDYDGPRRRVSLRAGIDRDLTVALRSDGRAGRELGQRGHSV